MPDLNYETAVRQQHGAHWLVAGVDEAGRGALAGPVTAAAVILPSNLLPELSLVNDSKQLSAPQRQQLADMVRRHAVAYGVASVPAAEIDQMGIIAATKLAMRLAIEQLQPAAQYLLIDGPLLLGPRHLPQQPIVRGDSLSLSIAAASILAKVGRDQHMVALAEQYPLYGLAQHKGYGTVAHRAALAQHGPSPIHRHTFAPLRQTLL